MKDNEKFSQQSEEDLTEEAYQRAVLAWAAYGSLHDPAQDIYTLEDGEPYHPDHVSASEIEDAAAADAEDEVAFKRLGLENFFRDDDPADAIYDLL